METAQMVRARMALESLYTDTCDIEVSNPYKRKNGATGQAWAILIAQEPCRVSYSKAVSGRQTLQGEVKAEAIQEIKLFIRPDLEVPEGSRIAVTRQGRVERYRASSPSALYPTHQEISLRREEAT